MQPEPNEDFQRAPRAYRVFRLIPRQRENFEFLGTGGSYLPITTIKLTTSISSSSPWPGCSPISPDILPPPVIYSCNFLGIAAVVLHWSVYMLVHRCWCVFPKRPLLLTFPRRANPLARRSPAAICVSPPPPISPPLSLYARPLHSHRTL